uniref:(northern house mosquito) hypothetical protein n=1 Tax=Culex pipiens TaxID=7175 RepID=A0A8D8NEC4_CULPI
MLVPKLVVNITKSSSRGCARKNRDHLSNSKYGSTWTEIRRSRVRVSSGRSRRTFTPAKSISNASSVLARARIAGTRRSTLNPFSPIFLIRRSLSRGKIFSKMSSRFVYTLSS